MFTVKEILDITGAGLVKGNPNKRITGVSIDSRTIKQGQVFVAIKGPRFDGHNFILDAFKNKASAIIASEIDNDCKNIELPVIKVSCGIKALVSLASCHRDKFKIPTIAVTGSNGKTTTKELIAHCLLKNFNVLHSNANENNQFGLSLNLFKLSTQHQACVMEIGTNNFGEIKYLSDILRPNIGVITNIGPSHLEGFKNLKGVFKEKITLLDNLAFPKIGLVNSDDKLLYNFLQGKPKNVYSFGYKNKADFRLKSLTFENDRLNFKLNNQKFSLNTIAIHNIYNALAAISVSRLFGLSYNDIRIALESFNWPAGRFKRHILGNIHLIDDAYNANPFSFASALDNFKDYNKGAKKILVMADMLELGSLSEKYHLDLAKKIISSKINLFIGLGAFSKKISDFLKANSRIESYTVKDTEEIIKILKQSFDSSPVSVLVKGSHAFKLENVILYFLSST